MPKQEALTLKGKAKTIRRMVDASFKHDLNLPSEFYHSLRVAEGNLKEQAKAQVCSKIRGMGININRDDVDALHSLLIDELW